MHDYVPPSDGDFDHFAREIFIPYVLAHFAALGLTGPESTALQNAGIAWGYAWTGYGNADQAMKAATTEKMSMPIYSAGVAIPGLLTHCPRPAGPHPRLIGQLPGGARDLPRAMREVPDATADLPDETADLSPGN